MPIFLIAELINQIHFHRLSLAKGIISTEVSILGNGPLVFTTGQWTFILEGKTDAEGVLRVDIFEN